MLKTLIWSALAFFLVTGAGHFYPVSSVYAQDNWRAEFDDICSKTTDSMALSTTELKGLIERCDQLRPRIEKLDESEAKVYLKRLQMCKDLFVFVLESKSRQ